ncbi:hypothetical protein SAMN02983003_0441 [Devosia enhydra]|uniref:Mannitol repressor n=1 Tax=Devosia enhydra TaxID=665118 RepID=A0A1K2HT61_9HYPH|nr:hypothetical protein [Devosia enhydra]SFZ81332.1 hypothetical protein SAMN02983003_0441 [Devosia enhydra]
MKTSNAAIGVTHPHLADFGKFLDEINAESPRGAALVAGAMLDSLMHKIVSAYLIEGEATEKLLTGFNAPLATSDARAAIAQTMGLISDKEWKEARRIAKVRNIFAHGVHVTFTDQKVSDLCRQLGMQAKPNGNMEWSARAAFTSAAMALILNLNNRPAYVAKRRASYGEWPL